MNVLAIDTAASLCAACVYDAAAQAEKGRVVLDLGKGHAEHIMGVIEDALRQAGLSYDAIGAVAVSVGPGSFTGVRVGVSAVRGLALALKIPAVGVSTLEAIGTETRKAFPERPVLVVLGRTEPWSLAYFDAAGAFMDGPRLAMIEDARLIAQAEHPVLAGEAAEKLAESAGGQFEMGSTKATADILVYARIAASRPPSGEKPKPLYLRAPDAKPQTAFALPMKG